MKMKKEIIEEQNHLILYPFQNKKYALILCVTKILLLSILLTPHI